MAMSKKELKNVMTITPTSMTNVQIAAKVDFAVMGFSSTIHSMLI